MCLDKQIFKLDEFTLQPIRDEDKFSIMSWRNDQLYHLRQEKPLSVSDQEHYFNTVVSDLFTKSQPNQILFSFDKDSEFIAYGGLVHIDWITKSAEISFVMDTQLESSFFVDFWTSFLILMEEVAFDELNFNKIFTYAFDVRPLLYEALKIRNFEEELSFINEDNKAVRIHSKIRKV